MEYMTKKKSEQSLSLGGIEKLLNAQTLTILSAVDEKLAKQDRKMEQMEDRFSKKLDKLITTLDKFLKRMTDMEDEFEIMKHDLNRVKTVLKEKLGVDLS